MKKCEVCGNEYENPMEIKLTQEDVVHHFDCFECAISALAPHCENCGVGIIGHGVQFDKKIFCSAHCARYVGLTGVVDHASSNRIVMA